MFGLVSILVACFVLFIAAIFHFLELVCSSLFPFNKLLRRFRRLLRCFRLPVPVVLAAANNDVDSGEFKCPDGVNMDGSDGTADDIVATV